MKGTIKVGLTGGIGSGKSTIAKAFENIGIPVYVSDTRSKWLTENDPTIIAGLKELLGEDIYGEDGRLDKKKMAGMIFNDKELLGKVNSLIHPIVFDDFDKWARRQSSPYVINEAAIMVESRGYKRMDKVIVVTAPEDKRILRTMRRDNTTRERVIERIKNQMSDEERVKVADFVIRTDDKHFVMNDILTIDKTLRNKK